MAITDDKNTLTLPGVDFHELAKQAITAQILKGFAASPELVTKVVASALTQKVNEQGQYTGRGYDEKTSFLEWTMLNLIQKATKEALAEQVDAMKPDIVKAVVKQLKAMAPSIAEVLVAGFTDGAKQPHYVTVSIGINKRER